MVLKLRNTTLDLSHPVIMGVVNVTPDSFSDGGRYLEPKRATDRLRQCVQDGAGIVDVGAVSTRPGARGVSEEAEWARLQPVLSRLEVEVPISIDTTSSGVARCALELGAHLINDVSGLRGDPDMAEVIAAYGAGVVLMHRRGTPGTMQQMTGYGDLVSEVKSELRESIGIALRAGIQADAIVIDPGIGFAKTPQQSWEILKKLDQFTDLGFPLLIGPSRKSFLGALLDVPPEERDFGTIAACLYAVSRGARLFRVHNVKALADALRVEAALN